MSGLLSVSQRHALLRLARESVVAAVQGAVPPSWDGRDATLAQPGAAFVTLRVRASGELRGCRGEIAAVRPLAASVIEGAVAAAVDDPRFLPVSEPELDGLTIEISVLTPMVRAAPDDVDVRRHGVLIEHRGRRGLFLPQVASEMGWSRRELLAGVCRKAGLPAGAWQEREALLHVFEAEVWGEEGDAARAEQ